MKVGLELQISSHIKWANINLINDQPIQIKIK